MKFNRTKLTYTTVLSLSALLLLSGWNIGFSGTKKYIGVSNIEISTVESGKLAQYVNGYGSLQSQNKRLITATSPAIVNEIVLKPGAKVEHDTIIMTLKNPKLNIQMDHAMSELHNAKTQRRKLKLEQQRELLRYESNLAQLKADAEMASLKADAQKSLTKSGIVSGIEAQRTNLQKKQLTERLDLEKQGLAKLKEVHREHLVIQDDSIKQAKAKFDASKRQVEELVITAGISGVLQRLPVSLGQSVSMGDELALVGSLNELNAEISVPQLQANLVQVGNRAEIDTRHGLVEGQVMRIDPVVQDGAVMVDIQLPNKLPPEVRPMQIVDAVIYSNKEESTSFVIAPFEVQENSLAYVYKLIDEDEAVRIKVQLGKISNEYIEVVSGLHEGDRIIISNQPIDQNIQTIFLVSD